MMLVEKQIIGGGNDGLLLAVCTTKGFNPIPKLLYSQSLPSLLSLYKPSLSTTPLYSSLSLSLTVMATLKYLNYTNLSLVIYLLSFLLSVTARPATFLQDFRITWSDSHIRQIEGGRAIQLVLDQSSGTPSSICFM